MTSDKPPARSEAMDTLHGDDAAAPIGRIAGCEFFLQRGIMIARVEPTFDAQKGSLELAKFVNYDAVGERTRLVINLETAPVVSAMMGVLLVQQNHCKRVGGQLALCGVKDLALEAFRLTKLDLLFKIYDTQDQAVAALVATLPR